MLKHHFRAGRLLSLIFTCILCASPIVQAEETRVAVASNFREPMEEIVKKFQQNNPYPVSLSFASSGKLYAQIRHGAPFDIFLSADQSKPAQLDRENAVVDKPFTYATGRLALWSADANYLVNGQAQLQSGNFHRLAMANPKLAPYGLAATEIMENLKLTTHLKPRLVYGENIAQTYQFVATGNAQLGFVALAQVLENGSLKSGSVWVVPTELHSPIRQDAVLLRRGQNKPGAKALINYLRSQEAQDVILRFGYSNLK